MTDYELEKINNERRRRGLPLLSRGQATTAVANNQTSSGFNSFDFLIGYETGIPMPSMEGIIGASMHPHHDTSSSSYSAYSAPDTTTSCDTSSSYSNDSSSSSSYDSGSSSSCDSGSSSGGSD